MILKRDDTFRVVFNIRTPVSTSTETVGSGIIVVTPSEDVYLVTATHVATSCTASSTVIISDQQGNPTSLRLIDFNRNMSWQHHPVADISVLPVELSVAIQPHLANRCFPVDHFHTDRTTVSRDVELTSVGFPNGLGATGLCSPLSYRSYASSALITLSRFDTGTPSDFFLLENPSIGG